MRENEKNQHRRLPPAAADEQVVQKPLTRKEVILTIAPRLLLIGLLVSGSLWSLLRLAADIPDLQLPSSIEGVHQQAHNLRTHSKAGDKEGALVFVVFCGLYLWKQTFAIPGSFFMNLLAGALYSFYGFPLVTVLTATGATLCYLLSYTVGGPVVGRLMPERLAKMRLAVEKRKNDLFFYMLFIRMFPFTPNWFVNISSPLIGVPIHYFFFAMLLGGAPYTFISTQAGAVVSEIDSPSDLMKPSLVMKLVAVSLLALIPPLVGKRMKLARKIE